MNGLGWLRSHRGQLVYALLAVLVATAAGYAVGRTQSGIAGPTRFTLTRTAIAGASIPGSGASRAGQGDPGEDYPVVYCGWPSGRTTITVESARTFRCSPYGAVGLPAPAPGSFEILSSPIGDKWPEKQNGNLSDELRFVKRSGGVLEVGPNLMEYGDYSGGARPSFDEARDSLWIFDYATEHGSEVIRISTASGELLQRTAMPPISRPVIGVNALGFWLAQDSDSLGSASTSQLGVWFARIGASKGELVMATAGSVWAMQPRDDAMNVFISPDWRSGEPAYELWQFRPAT